MATVANWNGHTFVVSPSLIRSFREMRIKGSCETTEKNSDKQKYVERKYGEAPEITLTVDLSALTGVTDVFAEAMAFVNDATAGATAYFYLGASKVFPAQLMLIDAQVGEVKMMPGRGDSWIECKVELKFKQGTKNDGAAKTSSGGGSSSVKTSVKTTTQTATPETVTNAVRTAMNTVATIIGNAQTATASTTAGTGALARATENVTAARSAMSAFVPGVVTTLKKVTTQKDTASPVGATKKVVMTTLQP